MEARASRLRWSPADLCAGPRESARPPGTRLQLGASKRKNGLRRMILGTKVHLTEPKLWRRGAGRGDSRVARQRPPIPLHNGGIVRMKLQGMGFSPEQMDIAHVETTTRKELG